jgi:ubiquinone/menaquinone biosynthesis C-methylase UbiE
MDDREAGQLWNENADAWTELARAGYDVYRDHLNTPAFLAMLPNVSGLRGLDIGCGEGHNTRLLARHGAQMTGIDIAPRFVAHARDAESREPLGISYEVASGVELPFGDATWDFATAFMSLMDMAEADRAIREAFRVIKPGGFLQFSISHPCTDTSHRRNLRDANGRTYALELGGYFHGTDGDVTEWLFGATPPDLKRRFRPFRTPQFHRPLSDWLNSIVAAGFVFERVEEPHADDETVRRCRDMQDTQIMPYFLHVRARKL